MTKFYLSTLIFLLISVTSFSQKKSNLTVALQSNGTYYLDDEVTGDAPDNDPFRSNNYLKVDYGLNNFEFGVQLEGYAPQALLNYSPNFNKSIGIGTFYAKYRTKKLNVTLGHFYEQFGSGLQLRAWEDRQLGINNALRGARINYSPTSKIKFTALYGKNRYGFDVSDGDVFGLNSEFDLSNDKNTLQVGLSYVGRNQEIETNDNLENITHTLSGRINYVKNNIYANIEGAVKSKDALVENNIIYSDKLFYGNAILLELGYSSKGIGFNTSLRRLENMNFYSDRNATGNTFNEQIINYIPALTKQQKYSLANIYVYQSQPKLGFNPLEKAGEIGLQWDFYYKIKKDTPLGGKYGTKLALNFSNWYGINANYNNDFKRIHVKFLDLGERYYTDFNFEVKKKLSSKTKMAFTYVNQYYNKEYIEERSGLYKTNIVAAEITKKFGNKKSYRLEAEHLWNNKDHKNWAAGTAELYLNSEVSLFATDMYNYGNDNTDERDHFYNFGLGYAKNKSRFTLSYGRQRGGLLCVGGVCRVVSPATGINFTINTSL